MPRTRTVMRRIREVLRLKFQFGLNDSQVAKLTADQRRDLMEVIDDRHQRGSTLLATQIPTDRWHDQIGDPTYADAILDRLLHNAYRIELQIGSLIPAALSDDRSRPKAALRDDAGEQPG